MAYAIVTCSSVEAAPTRSYSFHMQRTPELHFSAILGEHSEVELALV